MAESKSILWTVSLAKLLTSDVNTLILDELTNFLDIFAMEAFENLLCSYQGTVIFVSHDRQFVQHVAQRKIIIENQQIKFKDGMDVGDPIIKETQDDNENGY